MFWRRPQIVSDPVRDEAMRKIEAFHNFMASSGQFDDMDERADHQKYYVKHIKPLEDKYKELSCLK